MNTLDLPFPSTEYEVMSQYTLFNLIYPFSHPLCSAVKLDMMIRALSFSDPEYMDFLHNEIKPQDMTPVGGKLFEINYIRECKLSGVAKFEWENNYGPSNMREFLKFIEDSHPDDFVKVINLKAPKYSLKEFNQKYKINE